MRSKDTKAEPSFFMAWTPFAKESLHTIAAFSSQLAAKNQLNHKSICSVMALLLPRCKTLRESNSFAGACLRVEQCSHGCRFSEFGRVSTPRPRKFRGRWRL